MPHAMSSSAWFVHLTEVAPGLDRTILRILARLLAGGADVDALLLVTGALDDAAGELALGGRDRLAAEMRSLRSLLDARIDELSHRRGTFW